MLKETALRAKNGGEEGEERRDHQAEGQGVDNVSSCSLNWGARGGRGWRVETLLPKE